MWCPTGCPTVTLDAGGRCELGAKLLEQRLLVDTLMLVTSILAALTPDRVRRIRAPRGGVPRTVPLPETVSRARDALAPGECRSELASPLQRKAPWPGTHSQAFRDFGFPPTPESQQRILVNLP